MMTDLSLPQKLNIKPKLPQNPDHFEIISIGAGAIVNLAHLPAYRFAGFTIKGIFDVDKKRSEATAQKWDIPLVFETLNQACSYRSEKTIIYDLAIPSQEILSTLDKLPTNAHVLIQKPLGESLEEAQRIIDLCEERHIEASINFQLRYAPYILGIKDALLRGWLGEKINTIEIRVNAHMPWQSWPFLASSPRLELPYHSIHYIDLIRDLLSPYEPTAVQCRTSQHSDLVPLGPIRSSISFIFDHDPTLFVNTYTNLYHRWGSKHAQSYILIEGSGGAAKAQIGDNLAYGQHKEGEQVDFLQVNHFLFSFEILFGLTFIRRFVPIK